MTQDEIIEIAREAGGQVTTWVNHSTIQKTTTFTFESPLDYYVSGEHPEKYHIKFLEAFAKLVEEKATEKANARANASWTLMCEKMVAFEREACAKVCEKTITSQRSAWGANFCIAAIRARGEQA
jgi:hypothetical protein